MYGACYGGGYVQGCSHGKMGGLGRGECHSFGWAYGPTKGERKEWLEKFKKHLEERLSDVNEEIAKL